MTVQSGNETTYDGKTTQLCRLISLILQIGCCKILLFSSIH